MFGGEQLHSRNKIPWLMQFFVFVCAEHRGLASHRHQKNVNESTLRVHQAATHKHQQHALQYFCFCCVCVYVCVCVCV